MDPVRLPANLNPCAGLRRCPNSADRLSSGLYNAALAENQHATETRMTERVCVEARVHPEYAVDF
ncbi:MAG: hypothetical protein CMJ63_03425 [Planctomycetaceae bacterium]|nr:hypothetical protein [Planctomycetaceae bacterium]HCA39885.1 hypothetical protein [Phycisphaerales bacterium]